MSQPTKTSKPKSTVISAAFSRQVDCNLLYDQFHRQLGTNKVSLTLQGCMQDGTVSERQLVPTKIPAEDRKLSEVCPIGYNYFLVTVDYTAGSLLHNQLMTRADFVMEVLDIWETMRNRVSPHASGLREEIEMVMEYTRSVYSVAELADLSYMETTNDG